MSKTEKLLEVLNSWTGKEFNPGTPAQCAAFTRFAWEEAGLPLPVAQHPDDVFPDVGPNLASSFAGNEIGPKVEIRDVRAGDLVLFSNTYGNYPPGTITHVGTCVGDNKMVDRPTSAKPVMLRSIFCFGAAKIAQIRRPTLLMSEPQNRETFSVLLEEGKIKNIIHCNPQLIDNKIRVDLRSICISLGFVVSYDKENNYAIIRRK